MVERLRAKNRRNGLITLLSSSMDYTKFDKDGNPLDTVPQADRSRQSAYHRKWLESNKTRFEPTENDIKCELQLQALSYWEPLELKINVGDFMNEIKHFDDAWVPYLRREGIMNNREGLLLMGLEDDKMSDSLSMPEARRRVGRKLSETEFCYKTDLYDALPSLHPLLEYFQPLGRTMLVKANKGGFFPPHKDWPVLTRDTFRVVAFCSYHCSGSNFEWEMENQKMPIEPGMAYYVDTRKTHRTHSWADDSIHLIMNIPKTWENVLKLMSVTKNF